MLGTFKSKSLGTDSACGNIWMISPVWSGVVVSDGVAPGHKSEGQNHTCSSGKEEHTQAQQQREEGWEQGAATQTQAEMYLLNLHMTPLTF